MKILLLTNLALTTTALAVVEHKERYLGPTGLFGVTSPKDIKIVKVEPGSPADGKIKPGEIFTAAGGIPFKDKTRQKIEALPDTQSKSLTFDEAMKAGSASKGK